MKREKLIGIVCIGIFAICITLFIITLKEENNLKEENKITTIEEDAPTEDIVYEQTESTQAPKSDYKYDQVKFSYENTDLNIKSILEANMQLNYFQMTLYDWLCERGYDDVESIEITEVKETVDNIQFISYVTLENEEILTVKIDYDVQLLAFYYHFEKEELEVIPVNLTNVDSKLYSYIREKKDEIEREFGAYLMEEKLEASEAEVKWFEEQEGQLIIQVELNDEYLTYCKIYFDIDTGKFEFKKWG